MQLTATNRNGMTAKWIARGATLTELHVPDRDGKLADVVLGFDDLAGYESGDNHHFGATTGRFAGRIRNGQFTLDGVDYQLARNNGPHHLHGGPERALDKVTWEANLLDNGVRFTYSSPDGEEHFPGKLDVEVTYTLVESGVESGNSSNALRIEYQATTDKPTIINLTNHSYFNLSGHGSGSVLDHELWIKSDHYTIMDDDSLPTGEVADLSDTPFDFRKRQSLGARVDQTPNGYDHFYVIQQASSSHSDEKIQKIAEVVDPKSGRVMEVATDQPGVVLYIANGLHGQAGKKGQVYAPRSAICLETQHYPDSPNQPNFPSTVLRPGETYRHVCVYTFS